MSSPSNTPIDNKGTSLNTPIDNKGTSLNTPIDNKGTSLRAKAFIWGLLGSAIMSVFTLISFCLSAHMAFPLLTQDGLEKLSEELRSISLIGNNTLSPWQENTFLLCSAFTTVYITGFYLYKALNYLMLMMGFHCLMESCDCCKCLLAELILFWLPMFPMTVTIAGICYVYPVGEEGVMKVAGELGCGQMVMAVLLVAFLAFTIVRCERIREELKREMGKAKYLPILWDEKPAYELKE